MKRLFLLFVIIICIAPVLMQCEKQENIDVSKEFHWTIYTTSDGLVNNYIDAIAIDNEGNKWFGTDNGVSKFDGNTWTNYTTSDGLVSNYIQAITIDNEGNKWFLAGNKLEISKFDGNTWTNYAIPDFIHSTALIFTIASDNAGNLWFGTHMGVLKFDGNTWTNYTILDGLISNDVYTIDVDKKGNLWFVTAEGVSKFDSNTWTNYTISNGLASNTVHTIAVDKEGNMWFGTLEGISKFDGNTWTTYTISDGLISNDIYTIDVDKKGNLWFGTYEGFSKFDGSKWTNFKYPNFPASSESFCEFSFSDGQGSPWATIDAQDNLFVIREFEHYEGGCGGELCPHWFWSEIMFFNGKKWTTVFAKCPSEDQFLFLSFAIDKENNKWFGTTRGVIKLSN